ncbi:hypothetical protein ACM9W9_20020 [Xanthomonas sacchari]
MTSKNFLKLHLSLLLAQYGERSILEVLAPLLGLSQTELQKRINEIQKTNNKKSKDRKLPNTSGTSLKNLLAEYPEKAEIILKIQERFLARTFLPHLKDVRRFLDRHGQSSSTLKKRDEGFARIARQLVSLTSQELEAILIEPPASEYSSLGLISDQILGRK